MFFFLPLHSDTVEAQTEISRLQEELDGQREECYGHLKVMQQLKVRVGALYCFNRPVLPVWSGVFFFFKLLFKAKTSSPPESTMKLQLQLQQRKKTGSPPDLRGLQLELSQARRDLAKTRLELEEEKMRKNQPQPQESML